MNFNVKATNTEDYDDVPCKTSIVAKNNEVARETEEDVENSSISLTSYLWPSVKTITENASEVLHVVRTHPTQAALFCMTLALQYAPMVAAQMTFCSCTCKSSNGTIHVYETEIRQIR